MYETKSNIKQELNLKPLRGK